MKGFEEIAVIHSIDNYNEAMFLEGFLKWIGVAFFDYTYNDVYNTIVYKYSTFPQLDLKNYTFLQLNLTIHGL